MVANNQDTADDRRLFDYNILHNSSFVPEIYYQLKTYRLSEATGCERRLLKAYETCRLKNRGLHRDQQPQAGGAPTKQNVSRPGAASREPGSSRARVTGGASREPESSRARLTRAASREPGSSRVMGAASREPGSSRVTAVAPRQTGRDQGPSGQGQASGGSAAQSQAPPGVEGGFVAAASDFDGFTAHTHASPVKEAAKAPGSVDLIELVVRRTANMDQLDLFERRVKEDEAFQRDLANKLRLFRQQSALEDTTRLVKLVTRVAICNLFKV